MKRKKKSPINPSKANGKPLELSDMKVKLAPKVVKTILTKNKLDRLRPTDTK